MPWGDENPYRIFGVTEDSPYEEVESAYKELVKENEGNEKYCMQLEMMKEKIFDDRWIPFFWEKKVSPLLWRMLAF